VHGTDCGDAGASACLATLFAMSRLKIWRCAVVVLAIALAITPGGPMTADAAAASAVAAAPSWRWPTSPPGAIVQPFEAPPGPYAAGHRGIDLGAAAGQAVLAPAIASVQFAGIVVDRPVVTLRVDEHVLVSFEPVAAEAPVGAALAVGQRFGTVAVGGHCGDRCLHVGVRVDGQYVSPLLYFAGVPPAVLLPLG
jgi:hypothetical protein